MSDIFISYRRDGGDVFARLLYERLKANGYSVFYDVESLRSGKFNLALYERIMKCSDFLLVLSPGCLDRCGSTKDWLRQEIEFARNCDKNLIPLMLHGFEFPENLPGLLEDLPKYHGIKVKIEDFDSAISKLINNFLSSSTNPKDSTDEICQEQDIDREIKPDDSLVAPINRYSHKTLAEMMSLARYDTRKYEKIYRVALQAASGDMESQCRLGMLYCQGVMVKTNYAKAVYWLSRAARAGSAPAKHYLGKCYYHGCGVKRNYAQAVYWFVESAETDDQYPDVLCSLGDCYRKGKGVYISDIIRATEYYHRAIQKGSMPALVRYVDVLTKTTKKQKDLLRSYGYTPETISASQKWEYAIYKNKERMKVRMTGENILRMTTVLLLSNALSLYTVLRIDPLLAETPYNQYLWITMIMMCIAIICCCGIIKVSKMRKFILE